MTVDINEIKDEVANYNEEAIFWDGYEEAIIGIAERCGQPALVVYDRDKCIQINVDRDGMSYEEAVEWFEFNVAGAWVGSYGRPKGIFKLLRRLKMLWRRIVFARKHYEEGGTPLILSKLESIDHEDA